MAFNLKLEIKNAKKYKRTSIELKKYFLTLTHNVLIKHYGENYSDKCLQSSLAIKYLLACSGIKSVLVLGAVCMPVSSRQFGDFGWQGFWDQNHHHWIVNEYGEMIDLTIHQINRHPQSMNINRYDPPPVWWNNYGNQLSIIKYLPETTFRRSDEINLIEPEEQERLSAFLEDIKREHARFQARYIAASFDKVLCAVSNLTDWTNQSHPWAKGLLYYNDNFLALPEWIENREQAILQSHS